MIKLYHNIDYERKKGIISCLKIELSLFCLKLNILHPRMLCAKFDWEWHSGFGAEDINIKLKYFRYFVIIFPWKRVWPFIWTNLNPLHPKMLCAKIDSGEFEEDENVKIYQEDGRTRDNRRSEKRCVNCKW